MQVGKPVSVNLKTALQLLVGLYPESGDGDSSTTSTPSSFWWKKIKQFCFQEPFFHQSRMITWLWDGHMTQILPGTVIHVR